MVIERSKYYKLLIIRNKIRNGLFVFTLSNFLTRFGLEIYPYYWDKEEFTRTTEPQIKDNPDDYRVVHITIDEVGIMNKAMGIASGKLENDIQEGHLCMGLKHKGEIVAMVFAKSQNLIYKQRTFKLNKDQAYIYNLYTFEAHRGKNLAPYLRYQCYKTLEEMGVKEIYCITGYFNKPSLKSNRKLSIWHKTLFLYIGLFKKYYWNFTLKHY
ncbi:N-acetyltransferase [Arenibacter sp. TNZ]|jgi:ribosomal protein S18 acetylase RimI-like enzyme|uniref:GNAT family N-acetyltransferase n=1 Tax=Arenibacter TaxID=178469 RepID=UPI000CD3E5EF|nr:MULTISPECIES: GNAT family N-acetyltransferase [Arenibacter]MCM4170836.1 N-acetyltransferase [Arenibacter sp. TNZ]